MFSSFRNTVVPAPAGLGSTRLHHLVSRSAHFDDHGRGLFHLTCPPIWRTRLGISLHVPRDSVLVDAPTA